MKAIVPVAGYGTRLKPHTDKIQKALLPVAGKATLNYIIDPLLNMGIDEVTLIVGHLGDQVKDHVKGIPGNFNFIFQKERLGLGHAVYQGLDNVDTPVIIHLGDTIFDLNFKDFATGPNNRIAVGRVEDPRRFGVVDVIEGNIITGFYEKHPNPPTNLAISGLYYISSEKKLKKSIEHLIENDIRTKNEYQLTDALEIMLKDGEVFEAFELNDWMDVGVPETYIETNRKLIKAHHPKFDGVEIIDPVHIGENCQISSSKIGPFVTIMDGCSIDSCSIKNSIVLENSNLKHLQLSEKIVGNDGSDIC